MNVSVWQALNSEHQGIQVVSKNAGSMRSDAVYQSLRRAIIEQALQPATRLPEDIIGDQFGVSRTVVRQALTRLQGEGLVETHLNRGAYVAKPTPEEARDIFELRHCLEREVMRKLVERISVSGLDALESHVEQEERMHGRDGARSIRLAGEFHNILAELTGNRVLARYVSEVVSRCSLILAIYGRHHSSDCAVEEHRRLIQAIRESDAAAAMRLMDEHLGGVEERAQLTKDQPADLKSVLNRYAEQE